MWMLTIFPVLFFDSFVVMASRFSFLCVPMLSVGCTAVGLAFFPLFLAVVFFLVH